IGNVALHQARLLAEYGHEVTVFAPDYGCKPEILKRVQDDESVMPNSFRHLKIEFLKPLLKYGNAAWVPSLEKKLKGFDVVELHYPFFGGAGAVYRAQKKYGFKLMVYYHMDVVGRGFKKLVFWYNTRFFLPRLVRAADIVATSSADLGEHSYLKPYWDNQNSKFQVAPIGVDSKEFVFNGAPRERIVLFVGVLDSAHYFKGVEYLIRAITLIRHPERRSEGSRGLSRDPSAPLRFAQDDGVKLIIVGDGNLRAHYEKVAKDLDVADKVIFAGAAGGQTLVDYMQKAAVTVLPSTDSESFGIVLVESLACGTPVIASDLPGVRSVFENNISGFIVPPGDSVALAEKIKYILNNSEPARAMGSAGRKLVEDKYDWQKIGKRLNSLIIK
ncbi:MAG: glycosyltransferase family 4 protein, partial [Candidatus Komeilibacteria bacterium]|nr:glycosyltransferase family 4 protein [Candidatus Komeilibacteria bacterium]